MKAAIIGGSGYTGGELVRLLLNHPKVELDAVTSEHFAGKYLHSVHPNLRKRTDLKFTTASELKNHDVIFVALPHGVAMKSMEKIIQKTQKVVDLSADFRLKNPDDYMKWYGHPHICPHLLEKFVYGIPELHREEMKESSLVSGAGCVATSAILALYPLSKEGIIDKAVVDSKIGSSASGNKPNLSTHHAERSHVVRSYMPTRHRHSAEIIQECSIDISMSVHAVELVRGIMSTTHTFADIDEKNVWKLYRKYYGNEPFIRIVKEKTGVYRYPEPKILTGSNFCDIGFEKDTNTRLVLMSAIDNLMKGAAGQAVQAMNIVSGFNETDGLRDLGFHPI